MSDILRVTMILVVEWHAAHRIYQYHYDYNIYMLTMFQFHNHSGRLRVDHKRRLRIDQAMSWRLADHEIMKKTNF